MTTRFTGAMMENAAAYQFANKTALHLHYAATTTEASSAREMMEQAFLATANFLDQLNPEEIRYHSRQFLAEYSASVGLSDSKQWKRFLASQGDLLHQMGFQHKSVASIGDAMAAWNRQPVSFLELGDALDELYSLAATNPDGLAHAMRRTAFDQKTGPGLARNFAELVIVLAIIQILATDSDGVLSDSKHQSALYSFAASQVVDCVSRLSQATRSDSVISSDSA